MTERTIDRWRTFAIAFIIFALGVAVGCGASNNVEQPNDNASPPEGTKSFESLSRKHVEGPVRYTQSPSVGDKHNPLWQNCGYYSDPIHNEHAVHSMEHGAVWITYRPNLA